MRIKRLTAFGNYPPGVNGGYFLNTSTVHYDHDIDLLTLGAGVDWYFVHLGKKQVTDSVSGVQAKDIPFNY